MPSHHLAELYRVMPMVLIQAVKCNKEHFPEDFLFQLTWADVENLRSQIVTLKQEAHVKYLPLAFTKQSVSMLSSVLRNDRAIAVNIAIIRVFVKLCETLASHKELAVSLGEPGQRMNKKDSAIIALFGSIRKFMSPQPEKLKLPMGLRS